MYTDQECMEDMIEKLKKYEDPKAEAAFLIKMLDEGRIEGHRYITRSKNNDCGCFLGSHIIRLGKVGEFLNMAASHEQQSVIYWILQGEGIDIYPKASSPVEHFFAEIHERHTPANSRCARVAKEALIKFLEGVN